MPTKYGLAKQRAFDKEKAMTQPTTPANDDLMERAGAFVGNSMKIDDAVQAFTDRDDWSLLADLFADFARERVAAERAYTKREIELMVPDPWKTLLLERLEAK